MATINKDNECDTACVIFPLPGSGSLGSGVFGLVHFTRDLFEFTCRSEPQCLHWSTLLCFSHDFTGVNLSSDLFPSLGVQLSIYFKLCTT
jgi:hypothetical protein